LPTLTDTATNIPSLTTTFKEQDVSFFLASKMRQDSHLLRLASRFLSTEFSSLALDLLVSVLRDSL
jgi:hypothetical protein